MDDCLNFIIALRQMSTRDKRLNIHYGTFILSGLRFAFSAFLFVITSVEDFLLFYFNFVVCWFFSFMQRPR